MGNFSRDTFHREKGYVGVRLQQGVPLVDADWNELNDVVRQELYDALGAVCPNGVTRWNPAVPGYAFTILASGAPNDFAFVGGKAIVAGRHASLPIANLKYSTQPWTNPATAAHDGVAVIPPLTTPSVKRADLVYLDVWEREVGSAEDAEIVNPVIGIETAVRLKREVALRVVEGSITLPAAPAGHHFMPIAVLNRPPGGAVIQNEQIEERRSFVDSSPMTRFMSVAPVFGPVTLFSFQPISYSPWQTTVFLTAYAIKPTGVNTVGVIPLTLPDGAQLRSLHYRGSASGTGSVDVMLLRSPLEPNLAAKILATDTVSTAGEFDRHVAITAQNENAHLVDNQHHTYLLYASGTGLSLSALIYGLRIIYEC